MLNVHQGESQRCEFIQKYLIKLLRLFYFASDLFFFFFWFLRNIKNKLMIIGQFKINFIGYIMGKIGTYGT